MTPFFFQRGFSLTTSTACARFCRNGPKHYRRIGISKRPLSNDNVHAPASRGSKNPGPRERESTQSQRTNKDYTIGWICAITPEYVAAQHFLDEKHEDLEYQPKHDNNHYTLGRMWKHNVVIAVLPDGEYGISSATSVARDMLHSFPNVRVGLMVGVGGGAPSKRHDIRLGDVVVSAPRNGQGGVLQYDFGKSVQNRSFQCTGFLNQPPTFIRTAVKRLIAAHETGHQLQEAINTIFKNSPGLQGKYQRPDLSRDRLYKATVTHPPDSNADCTEVCNTSDLELRDKRKIEGNDLVIHYGQIASANQLMKDATIRDKLANEKDILCFEMEAAGLMNHFPCLVIRGICDYSDTHKNKDWQGYAAMAAAAYAKDLLRELVPNKVMAQKNIGEVLSSG
jgi:nucleoside phosphorylase